MKFRCRDCRIEGFASRVVYQCPHCGGGVDIVLPDAESFKEKAKLAKAQIEALTDDTKTIVICPFRKLCHFPDCSHAKPHEPLEFEHTTCRHYGFCPEYSTRCIPIEPEAGK